MVAIAVMVVMVMGVEKVVWLVVVLDFVLKPEQASPGKV